VSLKENVLERKKNDEEIKDFGKRNFKEFNIFFP
jgi:hypothetical protein